MEIQMGHHRSRWEVIPSMDNSIKAPPADMELRRKVDMVGSKVGLRDGGNL